MSIDPVPPLPPEVLAGIKSFVAKQPDITCHSLAINMILMDWLIENGYVPWNETTNTETKTGCSATHGDLLDYC